MAIATMPYSDGERSVATIMPPMADMTVEMVEPQKRLNPPLAETLAISIALVTKTLLLTCFLIVFMKLLKTFRGTLG